MFRDRTHAGQVLAESLLFFRDRDDVLVLALPRGGVVVGYEVSMVLGVPLDVMVVRKLGVPGFEELAFGALATGGVRIINQELVRESRIPTQAVEAVIAQESRELDRRELAYRAGRPAPDVQDKLVMVIDDGLATGTTMRAAVDALRQRKAGRIVVAVPVAPPTVCEELQSVVDEVVCVETPDPFWGVGVWYDDFAQVTDEEVKELLARAARRHPVPT